MEPIYIYVLPSVYLKNTLSIKGYLIAPRKQTRQMPDINTNKASDNKVNCRPNHRGISERIVNTIVHLWAHKQGLKFRMD